MSSGSPRAVLLCTEKVPGPADPVTADLFVQRALVPAAACGQRGELPLFICISSRASVGLGWDGGADLSSFRFYSSPGKKEAARSTYFCYV